MILLAELKMRFQNRMTKTIPTSLMTLTMSFIESTLEAIHLLKFWWDLNSSSMDKCLNQQIFKITHLWASEHNMNNHACQIHLQYGNNPRIYPIKR